MKKLSLIISVLVFSTTFVSGSFAATSQDFSNANFLADQGIITIQKNSKKYRLDDGISKQEMMSIALKLRGETLSDGYTCQGYFDDIKKEDSVCAIMERAVDSGILSKDEKQAQPRKILTRAEALAIIAKVYEKNIEASGSPAFTMQGLTDFAVENKVVAIKGITGEQNSVLTKWFMLLGKKSVKSSDYQNFGVNKTATRAQAFDYINRLPIMVTIKKIPHPVLPDRGYHVRVLPIIPKCFSTVQEFELKNGGSYDDNGAYIDPMMVVGQFSDVICGSYEHKNRSDEMQILVKNLKNHSAELPYLSLSYVSPLLSMRWVGDTLFVIASNRQEIYGLHYESYTLTKDNVIIIEYNPGLDINLFSSLDRSFDAAAQKKYGPIEKQPNFQDDPSAEKFKNDWLKKKLKELKIKQ